MSVDICWKTVSVLPVNALITGTSGIRTRLFASALAETRHDVHFCMANAESDWAAPKVESGTLVIDDVHALSPAAQQSLVRWMEKPGRRVRLIALANDRLHALVEGGRFRADLYYRLCIVQTSV